MGTVGMERGGGSISNQSLDITKTRERFTAGIRITNKHLCSWLFKSRIVSHRNPLWRAEIEAEGVKKKGAGVLDISK